MGIDNTCLTRRNFVRLSAAGAASALLFGGVGCAPLPTPNTGNAPEKATYTPGSYTASAEGKGGTLTVETVFGESAIESVTVTEHGETRYISDVALESIPSDIVEFQSLGIDTVTGASLTSMAILNAVEQCVNDAGGDASKLKQASGRPKTEEVVDIHADVVVVGAGASGMSAAIAAAQNGAEKVVVLEKTSNIGGNALVSGGYVEYIYAPQEMRLQMNDGFREYFEKIVSTAEAGGVDKAYTDWVRKDFEDYYADGRTTVYSSEELYMLELVILQSGGDFTGFSYQIEHDGIPYDERTTPFNVWLTEMGIEWADLCGIVGFPWPQWSAVVGQHCGDGYFDLFNREIDEKSLPIEIITLTAATELITENGKVVGVVGLCDDGTTYNVTSDKGVIVASGGFAGNSDMLREYNTMWNFDSSTSIPTTNAYGHTGDGITMSQAVGAACALMESEMLFPFADCKDNSTETIVGDTGNCMLVNVNGKRFVDETLSRFVIAAALMEQPEEKCIILSDANNCMIENGITQFKADEQFLLERGQLFKADTLEDLARQIGIDGAVLSETVAQFNQAVEAGKDNEFGRTTFTETSTIATPPFYASPRTWAAHITIGGVAVDEQYRALTEEGAPIEGLYVVGEAAVGYSGISVMRTGLACATSLFA